MSTESTCDETTSSSQQSTTASTCTSPSFLQESYSYSSSSQATPVSGSLQCYSNISTSRENEIYVTLNKIKSPNLLGHDEENKLKPKKSAASSKCPSAVAQRKKRKKKKATICTSYCKYDIIRRIASSLGMREVGERDLWNLMWTDSFISVERAKEMRRFQKVNHFPGMSEICRKDLLARNLNRMLKFFPKEYNFFPKTWCLPSDLGEVLQYSRSHRNKTFILKPDLGCRGRGIFLTRNLKDVKPFERMICQVYISKPFLVDGFKFDMRVYTLISSVDPLRIYVYNDGLARFATSRYCDPAPHNITNMYMHLTNYSVNKHSRTYVVDEEAGSKRRISTLNNWLERKQYNVSQIWASIDDIIIKTVIAGHPTLKHSYHACFPCHDFTFACFEILGFDIILDYKLKPYLLEVNHSPSYHTDAELDKEVKESLLKDTFTILNLTRCDKRRVMEEDRQRVRDRLMQAIATRANLPDMNPLDSLATQIKWEESHLGNYRQIYPSPSDSKYQVFFTQTQSSLFQETFASRAREEAGRLHREEFEMKLRGEANLRIGNKEKQPNPESPLTKPKIKKIPVKKKAPCNSFDPVPIIEEEEKERQALMAQRDFLVRSFRVEDQVKSVLKNMSFDRQKNNEGTNDHREDSLSNFHPPLPPRKLCSLQTKQNTVENCSNNSQKLKENSVNCQPVKGTVIEPPVSLNAKGKAEAYFNDRWHTPKSLSAKPSSVFPQKLTLKPSIPGLQVMCNEATIRVRPDLPASAQWPTVGAKSTKTHIARHFSNTVKIHGLERRLSNEKFIFQ
ncbi:tubulin polyglutamylase TTLL13-like [Macrosteles quadrilineatus]|uniref:tubulin polyglutamylase TTLL13-like n=1 Tax=Macrosteles quadrilineatus TaxID=74068 RepID=UPI0023E16604|nr:tubulin polyglutamylase TTLL13-like [Macrosteles quadrilineatus]